MNTFENQQQKVTEHFGSDPKEYADKYSNTTQEGYSFLSRRKRLEERLGRGTGRVLDIGCGPGVMTKQIRDLGWTYMGIDISKEMIELAVKRFDHDSSTQFKVGPVENIEEEDNSFDVVVAMGLVEYVANDEAVIQEVKRVLKPGGLFIVSLPNWWSPVRLWDRLILKPFIYLKRRFITKKEVGVLHREYVLGSYKNLLKQNNFEVECVDFYNFRVVPRPFDYIFPRMSIFLAGLFEPLRKVLILRNIGTGINISARLK